MTSEAFGTRLVPIDFDGNSSTDIFFSRSLFDETDFLGREFAVWTTGPQGVIGQSVIGDVSSEWSFPVFADSNGNGNTDLWFNRFVPGEGDNPATREYAVWTMNGTEVTGQAVIGSYISGDWFFNNYGDFDGNNSADLLFDRVVSGEGDTPATRQFAVWTVNGTEVTGQAVIGSTSLDWSTFQRLGDFNGNGATDLLFDRVVSGEGDTPATREYAVWTLNGTEVTGQAVIGSASTDWFISDVADFDGNGSDDLLFNRFVSGEGDDSGTLEYAVWTLNGTEVTGQAVIGSTSTDWGIFDVADFDGNGSNDLLFSRFVPGEGENPARVDYAVWTLNGTEVTGQAIVGSTSGDWLLSGVNDFNGNGSEDLLFSRSFSGGTEFAVWLLNGTEVLEQKVLGTAGEDWSFAGSADFNGNGIADLGFINFGSSELAAWTLGADGSITSQSVVGTYDNVEDLAGWTPSLGTFV